MSSLGKVLATFALGALATGCTIKTVDGPLTVTTKPVPEALRPDVLAKAKEVTGESCSRVLLFFIPLGFATVDSAVEDALKKAPGTDTLLRYEERQSLVSAFLYWEVCTVVHGYAVASKDLGAH